MTTARHADDFLGAARAYRKLIERGVRNGPLYYNLGTALLEAGQYDGAVFFLTRAERYTGSTRETRRNLRLALARQTEEDTATLPWYRLFLFWHYRLSTTDRMGVTVLAVLMFCTAGAIRVWKPGNALNWAMGGALLAAIVLASSVAATLYLEQSDIQKESAMLAFPARPEEIEQGETS